MGLFKPINKYLFIDFKKENALDGVAQLVGALSRKLQGHRFDSWSGHMPGVWVWCQQWHVQEATN